MEQCDRDEKSEFQSCQSNTDHLLRLVNARNFARENYVEFVGVAAKPARERTLELQKKTLDLAKRIVQLKNQREHNNSRENNSLDR